MTTLPQINPMRLPRPGVSYPAVVPAAQPPAHVSPVAPGGQASSSMTGADVWRVIRANLWLIIGLLIASGVGGYFGNIGLMRAYPLYRSSALIRVQLPSELPQIDSDNRAMLINEPSPQSIQVEQETQVAGIQDPSFLQSVLENAQGQIRQTGWFAQFGGVDEAKQELQKKLSVSPVLNTRLIEVAMSCHDPNDALKIVRDIATKHVNDHRQKTLDLEIQKSQNLSELISRYEGTLSTLHSQIALRAKELASHLSSGSNGPSGLDYELQELLHIEAENEKAYAEARNNLETFIKAAQQGLTPLELADLMPKLGGPSGLGGEIDELEAQLNSAINRFGPDSQVVKDLQNRLQILKQKQEDSEGATRDRGIAAVRMSLESKVKGAEEALKAVEARLAKVESASTEVASKIFEVNQLKEQEQMEQAQLQKARDEYEKLQLYIQQNLWSTAELAAPPDLPSAPTFPRLWMTMTAAMLVGLCLSLGIAFLREITDTSVRSPRDIAKVGQLNLLGLIPHEADDPQLQGARLPLAIYEAPHSMIAEQFRHVRTRLQHAASLDTIRSLLVTGTSPNDGKTTVACNLATGLALNGRRILLVDANFRRPQVHNVFNLPNDLGFGDVLNSLDTFDDAVRETEVPNLSVLPSGVKPSNPTELLESQLLIDFIERALEEYDHVIFDSGPLLLVSETAALAPRVDGVVTVVRARDNSRGMLQRLRDQLRQLKAEHLGVILNAVRAQSGGYYAPMIRSYYAYQNS